MQQEALPGPQLCLLPASRLPPAHRPPRHLLAPPRAAELRQVQSIWQFKGPCFPQSDQQQIDLIGGVTNPLTNTPWGHQQQSGSYPQVCQKADAACDAAGTLFGASAAATPTGSTSSGNSTSGSSGRRLLQSSSSSSSSSSSASGSTASCANKYW